MASSSGAATAAELVEAAGDGGEEQGEEDEKHKQQVQVHRLGINIGLTAFVPIWKTKLAALSSARWYEN